MRRAWILVALAGCTPRVEYPLPAFEDGRVPKTVVLLGDTGGDVLAGDAITLRHDMLPIVADRALLYSATPEMLDWKLGPFVYDPERKSRLRRPDGVMTMQDGAWVPLPFLDPTRVTLRFGPDDDACADGRQCFDDDGYCTLDCGAPDIAPPAPPAPWVTPTCPAGIELVTTMIGGEAITSCDGVEDPRCTGATRATNDGRCVPIGRPCDSDAEGWPKALPAEPIIWVKAGAAPMGDGTRARPYNLRDALARGPISDTLVLSEGRHRGRNGQLYSSVYGACVERTQVLLGTNEELSVDASTIAIDGLTLDTTGVAGGYFIRVDASGVINATGAWLQNANQLRIYGRFTATDVTFERAPFGKAEGTGGGREGTVRLERAELRASYLTKIHRAELDAVVAVGHIRASAGATMSVTNSVLWVPEGEIGLEANQGSITIAGVVFKGPGRALAIQQGQRHRDDHRDGAADGEDRALLDQRRGRQRDAGRITRGHRRVRRRGQRGGAVDGLRTRDL